MFVKNFSQVLVVSQEAGFAPGAILEIQLYLEKNGKGFVDNVICFKNRNIKSWCPADIQKAKSNVSVRQRHYGYKLTHAQTFASGVHLE